MSIMRHLDRCSFASRAFAHLLASTALLALVGCVDDKQDFTPGGPEDDRCETVVCGDNAACDAPTGDCLCLAGYEEIDGVCARIHCTSDDECDDGLACNGEEFCDADAGRCVSRARVTCDANAACEEPTGECTCLPGMADDGEGCAPIRCESDADCDDGNLCNGTEVCNPTTFSCEPGADRVVCDTRNTVCQPESGECLCPAGYESDALAGTCTLRGCATDADCDDGIACNGEETCNLATNSCQGGARIACGANMNCNEAIAQTDLDAACECKAGFELSDTGACVAAPKTCSSDADCSTNVCFGAEVCDTDAGRCVAHTPCGTSALCNPLAVTEDALCSCPGGYTGDPRAACTILSCTTDADCDDGIYCNGDEVCGSNGKCMVGGGTYLNARICERNAVCDETAAACVCADGYVMIDGACVLRACNVDADCDDGLLCNGTERCDLDANACVSNNDPVVCGANEVCDARDGSCLCDATFARDGDGCAPIHCYMHSDCDDGRACNGIESCDAATNTCQRGVAMDCGADGACIDDAGESWCECPRGQSLVDGACVDACPVPQAPVMTLIRNDAVLEFTAPAGYAIELAELGATEDIANAGWMSGSSIDLAHAKHDKLRVVARTRGQGCSVVHEFDWTYTLVDAYPGLPVVGGKHDLRANVVPAYIPAANGSVVATAPLNPSIKQWVSGVARVAFGTAVDPSWRVPEKVYGPALGTFGIVVLGNQGQIDLTFDQPIANGPGPDFAVYENGFGSGAAMIFAEIGFTEVSSDGKTFVRFDQHCLQPNNPGAYGSVSMGLFNNVAGTAPALWGTPFDLEELRNRPEVLSGKLDLNRITHVRIIDIDGLAPAFDAFGNQCWDATPTWGSGGFDLDAVGVLNVAP